MAIARLSDSSEHGDSLPFLVKQAKHGYVVLSVQPSKNDLVIFHFFDRVSDGKENDSETIIE